MEDIRKICSAFGKLVYICRFQKISLYASADFSEFAALTYFAYPFVPIPLSPNLKLLFADLLYRVINQLLVQSNQEDFLFAFSPHGFSDATINPLYTDELSLVLVGMPRLALNSEYWFLEETFLTISRAEKVGNSWHLNYQTSDNISKMLKNL